MQTYLEALRAIKNSLFTKDNIIVPVEKVMLDFELAMQQALKITFPNIDIDGCWFHFCQAILKNINAIGCKIMYQNDSKFKLWVNQFMAIALIPLEDLEKAMDLILEKTELDNEGKKVKKFILFNYLNNI